MIKVLAFDTFGTVTDWHTGVTAVLAAQFPTIDASQLARDWRRTYSPALAAVESGARAWTLLDDLHGEALDRLLREEYEISPTPAQLDAAVQAWHTIPGWPDSADGIRRLKSKFIVSALSNGNVALLTEMAKLNKFEWDFIGGADVWMHYKPAPEVYLGIAKLMQVHPGQVLMLPTSLRRVRSACARPTSSARANGDPSGKTKPAIRATPSTRPVSTT